MYFRDYIKWKNRFIAFSSDMIMTLISWYSACWLANHFVSEQNASMLAMSMTILQSLAYMFCGLYRGVWRFASIPDLIRILKAIVLGTFLSVIFLGLSGEVLPINILIIDALLLTVTLSGSRLVFRWLRDYRNYFSKGKRVLIVGAGDAGEGIIRDLYRSASNYKYLPVAIVDDDPTRHGCEVRGVRVLGSCQDIPVLVKNYHIDLILIAIPSASSKRMRDIVEYCEHSKVPFRTLPSLKDIADGSVTSHALREVLLEDLLGREQVDLDWKAICDVIKDKVIVVTGGGGSIGSELCRQICALGPRKLIIIDNNEFNLYSIELELTNKFNEINMFSYLCNITDKIELESIFEAHQPQLVFHVAAFKHVPLLERHVRVSMFNNVIGTKIVAETADKYQVQSFVLISTDKAVNPTSVMGATKRASEIFCQTFNTRSNTRFVTVRFGNVLESAGSVIPLFRSQLRAGGPLTVTHRDITRYFMTIPEASQLILQAITINQQGDIFVLDMGEPINIRYLAEQLIKLSGKIVGQDIDIVYTGLRPGEKLYEELFHQNENICETIHPKIKQAKVREYEWEQLLNIINAIESAYKCGHCAQLKELLQQLVPEYMPSEADDYLKPSASDNVYTDYSLSTV